MPPYKRGHTTKNITNSIWPCSWSCVLRCSDCRSDNADTGTPNDIVQSDRGCYTKEYFTYFVPSWFLRTYIINVFDRKLTDGDEGCALISYGWRLMRCSGLLDDHHIVADHNSDFGKIENPISEQLSLITNWSVTEANSLSLRFWKLSLNLKGVNTLPPFKFIDSFHSLREFAPDTILPKFELWIATIIRWSSNNQLQRIDLQPSDIRAYPSSPSINILPNTLIM